jgi:hypothetical protein
VPAGIRAPPSPWPGSELRRPSLPHDVSYDLNLQRLPSQRVLQLPNASVFLVFRRRGASPPPAPRWLLEELRPSNGSTGSQPPRTGGGLIRVAEGKSKAARRILPMTPRVFETLRNRFEVQGRPSDGWIFPNSSFKGHLNHNTTKDQHAKALAALEKAHKENPTKVKAIPAFEPYCFRHTALTRLADAGCDAFTLAKIAGHSPITITMRYCHPQAEAVERAFNKLGQGLKALPAGGSPGQVGTKLGTVQKGEVSGELGEAKQAPLKCGAEGRNRTGTGLAPQGILSLLLGVFG